MWPLHPGQAWGQAGGGGRQVCMPATAAQASLALSTAPQAAATPRTRHSARPHVASEGLCCQCGWEQRCSSGSQAAGVRAPAPVQPNDRPCPAAPSLNRPLVLAPVPLGRPAAQGSKAVGGARWLARPVGSCRLSAKHSRNGVALCRAGQEMQVEDGLLLQLSLCRPL